MPVNQSPIESTTTTKKAVEYSDGHHDNHSHTMKKSTTKKKKKGPKKVYHNGKNHSKSTTAATSRHHHHHGKSSVQHSSTATPFIISAKQTPPPLAPPSTTAPPSFYRSKDNIAIPEINVFASPSSSPIPAAVAEAGLTNPSPTNIPANNKIKDSLMGSMLGVLGGISVLLITIIIFAGHRRRKGRREGNSKYHGKRGWGVRHSWYSSSDSSVTSRCPSTLPPPYDEDILKKQELLEPPSPTVTKSTQYTPQLAYSPSFSVDPTHLIQAATKEQQQEPLPPPPPAASITTNSNNTTISPTTDTTTTSSIVPRSNAHNQQEQLVPPPPFSVPVPRPSRSLVRTYQAQLNNNNIGSSPNEPNYPQ